MFSLLLRNRQAQTKLIDKRVGLMGEIINNVRAIKLYAYERSMSQKVSTVREEEMVILQAYGGLRSTLNSLFGFIPVLAAVCKCMRRDVYVTQLMASDLHNLLTDRS
jgi:ATP-binding cassette subfamily C (CFTR/MRP) protein 1